MKCRLLLIFLALTNQVVGQILPYRRTYNLGHFKLKMKITPVPPISTIKKSQASLAHRFIVDFGGGVLIFHFILSKIVALL